MWGVTGERWWSLCQVPSCRWKSSHDGVQVAIDAIHRHLITRHLREPTDARHEPDNPEGQSRVE